MRTRESYSAAEILTGYGEETSGVSDVVARSSQSRDSRVAVTRNAIPNHSRRTEMRSFEIMRGHQTHALQTLHAPHGKIRVRHAGGQS